MLAIDLLQFLPLTAPTAHATYNFQVKLAQQAYPDFDRVVNDESAKIPQAAIDVITQGGLPNAAGVSYYLGRHRQEVDHLCRLANPRKVEERILELSMQLMQSPGGQAMDTLSYRSYRKIRDQQERERY